MAKDLILDVVARKSSKDLTTLADEFEKLANKSEATSKSLSKTTSFSKLLDDQIAKTKLQVKDLGAEFDRTGNKDVFANLRGAQSNLKSLERIKRDLSTAIDDGAKKGADKAEVDLRASLIKGAIGAAPLIGSAIGAGVLAAGGLGLIAAGIIDQAKSPAVKAAFGDLGHQAKAVLDLGSAGFAPVLVKGAHDFGAELEKVSPKLVEIESRMAPLLGQLFTGGVSFFDRILPGVDALSEAAGPVLTTLARELPGVGDAISTALKEISAGAPGAASGLQTVLHIADGLIIGAGKVVEVLERIPAPTQAAVLTIVAVGLAVNALAPKVKSLKDTLSGLGGGVLAADTRLGSLARTGAKVALVIGAVQVASAALGHSDATGVATTTKALQDLADTGAKTSKVTQHLDYDLGTLKSSGLAKAGNAIAGFTESLTGLGNVFDESLTHAQQRIGSIDAALAQEVQSGHADAAAEQFLALAAAAQKQGISLDDLKNGLPQFTDAMTAAGLKTDGTASSMDDLTRQLTAQKNELDNLTAAWDKWAGVSLKVDQANLTLHQDVLALTESIGQNGRTWDLNTKAGQANYGALLQAIQGARDYRQAQIDAYGTTAQANAEYQATVDKLLAQAKSAGLSASEIGKLKAQVGGLVDALNSIDTDITIRTHFITQGTPPSQFFHGLAHGGLRTDAGIRHAAVGMVIPPSNPGTVLAGEPQTGGEVLAPLRGISRGRAMQLAGLIGNAYGFRVGGVDAPSAWYGASGRTGGAVRAGGGLELRVTGNPDSYLLTAFLNAYRAGAFGFYDSTGQRVEVR